MHDDNRGRHPGSSIFPGWLIAWLELLRQKAKAGAVIDWSLLVGYDFFISYRRSDASPYANTLFTLLRNADFRCFLDDNDAAPGTPLTARLLWALKRSRKLIILASPDLVHSEWVPRELEIFAAKPRDIIPVNIAGGLTAVLADPRYTLLSRRGMLWIDEIPEIGPGGTPSDSVVYGVQKGFGQQRANRNLRLLAGLVALCLAIFAGVAYVQRGEAQQQLKVALSQATASEARRVLRQEPYAGLKLGLAAFAIQPSLEAQIGLVEGLSRIPKVMRYFTCEERRAVGVTFSLREEQLLAFACLDYRNGSLVTSVTVARANGAIERTLDVSGDGRNLRFAPDDRLEIGPGGTLGVLDWRSGELKPGAIPEPPEPSSADTDVIAARLDTLTPCVEGNPRSTRYAATAISPNGKSVVYTTEANALVVANGETGSCDAILSAHTHNVLGLTWNSSGSLLASAGAIADGDGVHGIVVWNLRQVHPLANVVLKRSFPRNRTRSVIALADDGSSWLCAGCGDTIVWDGKEINTPPRQPALVYSAAVIREDKSEAALASEDGHVVRILRGKNGLSFRVQSAAGTKLLTLAYQGADLVSVDERGARWVFRGTVEVGERTSPAGAPLQCYENAQRSVEAVFERTSDSKALRLEFITSRTAAPTWVPIPSDFDYCSGIAFAPQARLAARLSVGYRPILLAAPGRPLETIVSPLRDPSGLPKVLRHPSLSADGHRLLVTANGQHLALFDVTARRLVGVLDTADVEAATISANGNRAMTVGEQDVIVWDLEVEHWVHVAQLMVGRSALPTPGK